MANILVVEDDAAVLEVISEFLSSVGHTAFGASTVDRARELLASERIDLLLADQLLPKYTGHSIVEDALTLCIPILLMTGHLEAYEAPRAAALPMLRKPFHLSELMEAVARALPGANG